MAVEFKDYYETLGVPRTATSEVIKKAFRKLARVHHPDVSKAKDGSDTKFKEINEAYEVLGDPAKRKRFDELGAHWQDEPRAAPQDRGSTEFDGTGFSDFFETFFTGRPDGFGGAGRTGGEAFHQRGRDVDADILVSLEEALNGSLRTVTVRQPPMNGSASPNDSYSVRIPAGVREGQRLRVKGKGNPGTGSGAVGDLYLRVRYARHPDFTVQGSDLYFTLLTAPWEAVLGTAAKVPTLTGSTTIKVPPGTQAETQLRIRGQGLPREDGARGDLFATVRIQTPLSVTDEERGLWEQLAAKSTFKPRPEP